jgi:phosphoglucomutase
MSHRDPRAGQPAQAADLVDIPALLAAYVDLRPDPAVPAQRVAFGTSGHRGSALDASFNEWHVLAISQAICEYRATQGIDGPLYIGCDTHALSARRSTARWRCWPPTACRCASPPVGIHADAGGVARDPVHNRGRDTGLADGILITPSHNPPRDGGFKYNPANGGPASPMPPAGSRTAPTP